MKEERPTTSILVVDDDPEIVSLLVQTVGTKYRVLGADSGIEALGLIGANRFSAVVTDQRMPGMTGVELARQLHREDPLLSVVLLTAYTDPADVIAAINEGQVFRYVTKPWNVPDLLLTVKAAVERTELSRENARLNVALNHQLNAVTLLGQVGRETEDLAQPIDLLGQLLQRLEQVLPYAVAAAAIVQADRSPPILHIHSRVPLSERALTRVRDLALDKLSQVNGGTVGAGEAVVRVSGSEGEGVPFSDSVWAEASAVMAPPGKRARGVLLLCSEADAPYTVEQQRLLAVLSSELALLLEHHQQRRLDEQRYAKTLLLSLVEGVIVATLDGTVVLQNSAATKFFQSEARDKDLWQAMGHSPREALAAFERDGPAPQKLSFASSRGNLPVVVTPVFDVDRRLAQVVYTIHGLADGQRHEEQQNHLLATLAHELKNPLVAVQNALDVTLRQHKDQLPSEVARQLGHAREAGGRMARLLTDLMDLSRQHDGRLLLGSAKVDGRALLQRLCAEQRLAAENKAVEIVLRSGSEPLLFEGDESRVAQIVGNLLVNAVKFAAKGSTVILTADYTPTMPRYFYFSVWNEGPEIPPAEQARIFERFEQGSTAALVPERGSGLGLSIATSLVSAHRGLIGVSSGEGTGTLFSVALPVSQSDSQIQDTRLAASEEPLKRVLVVDDDLILAEFLRLLLSRLGCEVVVAAGADQALAWSREKKFDLMMSDVNMPEVDGLVLTEALRHDPMTRRTPVIVYSLTDHGEAAKRAGAVAFFMKPLPLAEVVGNARRAFEQGPVEQKTLLVLDPDSAEREVANQVFSNLGYRVFACPDAAAAESVLFERHVDIALVPLELSPSKASRLPPGEAQDGIELMSRWRREHVSAQVMVLILARSAVTADKVRALRAGAEDYLVKPIDAIELAARVESALRRREREVSTSPTTRLPGSVAIEHEVASRLNDGQGLLLCYFDIDHFKAFNDVYGYARADAVIGQTGDIFREVVARFGNHHDFIGHIAGDDFVCVFNRKGGERLVQKIVQSFDKIVPLYYTLEDRRRGYIEADDRYGQRRRFPIMGLSVAAIDVAAGQRSSYAQLSAEMAEIKKQAKAISGSAFLLSVGGQPPTVRSLAG